MVKPIKKISEAQNTSPDFLGKSIWYPKGLVHPLRRFLDKIIIGAWLKPPHQILCLVTMHPFLYSLFFSVTNLLIRWNMLFMHFTFYIMLPYISLLFLQLPLISPIDPAEFEFNQVSIMHFLSVCLLKILILF